MLIPPFSTSIFQQFAQQSGLDKRSASKTPETLEALENDEFERSRNQYQLLKTVVPHYTLELMNDILKLLQQYKKHHTLHLSAEWGQTPQAQTETKAQRLQKALWIFSQLQAASSDIIAMNQLACALDQVEKSYDPQSYTLLSARKPLRLTFPVVEVIQGKPLQTCYGIAHIAFFRPDGAVQIQCLRDEFSRLSFPRRAHSSQAVVLTKSTQSDSLFWDY